MEPDSDCVTINSYKIYFNSNTYDTSELDYTFSGLTNCSAYTFSVSSLDNNGHESSLTSINAVPLWPDPPKNLQYTTTASGTINLTWEEPDSDCVTIYSYRIYFNSNTYDTSELDYTFSGLTNCSAYTFSVSSLDNNNNQSLLSTINNVVPIWYNPPTNLIEVSQQLTSITGLTDGLVSVEIAWTPSSNSCSTIGFKIYQNNILIATVPSSTTSYIINNLSTNQTYNFNVTSFATGIESSFSETLIVSLPVIYTTTGSPLSSYSLESIMLKYSFNGTFIFNYNLLMEYTLVGGGGGGGLWSKNFDSGSTGGGGGHILNTNSSRLVSKDTFNLFIGTGGAGGYDYSDPLTSIGKRGSESSIVGTLTLFNVSTQNSVYSGQGGRGAENFSWEGGGGPGGNSTSANGGIYNSTYKNGTGGAGGSLTLVDTNNMIISTTLGGGGFDSQISSGGNGGAGHQGIDGSYYGGGGGGGGANSATMTKGIGGTGGGGNGTQSSPYEAAEDGKSPGGGGGGSNNYGGPPEPKAPLPGNGANGIIIIKFTNP
jgi:hypothetical protein